MKAARYRMTDGQIERVIFNVNDIGDIPEGWFPSELEAVQAAALASPAPSPSGAPAASRPKGRPKRK